MSDYTSETDPQTEGNIPLVIVTLLLASTLTVMVSTVISPALPGIYLEFKHIRHSEFLVRLVLTLPSIFVAVGAPIFGLLIDRIGRKHVLLGSTLIYGLSGGAGFLITTLPLLLISRAILGIGAAGVFVATITLITDYFHDPYRRDTILGWQGTATTFGGVLFLMAGGILTGYGWHTPFLIYAGSLLLIPLIVLYLHEPHVLQESPTPFGDSNPRRQLFDQLPIRTLVLIYGIGLVGNIVFFMVPVEIPFYLEALTSEGSVETGIAVAISALFSGIIASQYGRVRNRLSVRTLIGLMFAGLGIGFGIVSLASTYVMVVIGLAITGLGFGLLPPTLNTWIATAIPTNVRGRAFGGLTSAFFLGQFISPIVSSPLANHLGLGRTFGVGAIILLGSGVLFVILIPPPTRRTNQR